MFRVWGSRVQGLGFRVGCDHERRLVACRVEYRADLRGLELRVRVRLRVRVTLTLTLTLT